jgi:hypothetical protein
MQILILALVGVILRCEMYKAVDPLTYDYPSTVVTNLSNINGRKTFIHIKFPWPILMHGGVYFGTNIYSNSSLRFGSNLYINSRVYHTYRLFIRQYFEFVGCFLHKCYKDRRWQFYYPILGN